MLYRSVFLGCAASASAFSVAPCAPNQVTSARCAAPVALFGKGEEMQGKVVPTGGLLLPSLPDLPSLPELSAPTLPTIDSLKDGSFLEELELPDFINYDKIKMAPRKSTMEFDEYGRMVKGTNVPKSQKLRKLSGITSAIQEEDQKSFGLPSLPEIKLPF